MQLRKFEIHESVIRDVSVKVKKRVGNLSIKIDLCWRRILAWLGSTASSVRHPKKGDTRKCSGPVVNIVDS
jgi:glucose-6-phosphate dehydrogenase assembly protein OpcA